MLQPCSIQPNMINAPWLDKPTSITESELNDLEDNYQNMLDAIRKDTFGGIKPPKKILKSNKYHNSDLNRKKRKRHHHRINDINPNTNNDESFTLFDDQSNLLSQLEFHNNTINNSNQHDIERINTNYNQSRNALMSAEINLSVQRVRMLLNNSESPSSLSISPIQHSNNNSSIHMNDVSAISSSISMTPSVDVANNNNNHRSGNNLSLHFMSTPNDNNNNNDNNSTTQSVFIAQSISPPINNNNNGMNMQRRSHSEQPLFTNANGLSSNSNSEFDSGLFGSAPPPSSSFYAQQIAPSVPLPPVPNMPSMSSSMMLSNHEIMNIYGIPESVTSSMMISQPSANNNNSFNDNNNNGPPPVRRERNRPPQAPQRPQRRRRNPNRNNNNNRNRRLYFHDDESSTNSFNSFSNSHAASNPFLHDMINDIDEESTFGPVDVATPTNLNESRSNSISLDAPRPHRRHHRRNDVSSINLTGNLNLNNNNMQ